MSRPKAPIINYHHKQPNSTDNISAYQKACPIDLLASMDSLKIITLYTQIHQYYEKPVTKIIEIHNIFMKKS